MPATAARLVGISSVGHVAAGPTDVPWGETQKDGVSLQLSLARVDVRSGQGPLKLASHVTEAGVAMAIRMLESALQRLGYMLGLPSASFTGNLVATPTPSAEVLVIDGELGSEELQLYALGVGPVTTRRIDAKRAVLTDPGSLAIADNAYMQPAVTFELLKPATGDFLKITDAAS